MSEKGLSIKVSYRPHVVQSLIKSRLQSILMTYVLKYNQLKGFFWIGAFGSSVCSLGFIFRFTSAFSQIIKYTRHFF